MGHFLFIIVQTQCTASQTDRQTDDIIMIRADHTAAAYNSKIG